MSGTRTTLVGTPVVEAPGKIFLVGEYAVLDGGVAVLAAVSRYAVAQYVPGIDPQSAVVEEAVGRSLAAIGEASTALPPGSVMVDTDAFSRGKFKLGLGSSAATAAATVGAMFETAGLSIAGMQREIFSIAEAAHQAAQAGVGSGADVAAAVWGGFIKFVRPSEGSPVIEPIAVPASLRLVVFWTGESANTRELVQSVRSYAQMAPSSYGMLMGSLRTTAERFVNELGAGRATGAVVAAGRYGRQLAELGKAAGVKIVTPVFEQAAALARELGGDAKPSGAGGGDVGVALFATPESATLFARACQPTLSVLDVSLAHSGVCRRSAEEPPVEARGPFHVG
jgi:phosphomevalonate kinase